MNNTARSIAVLLLLLLIALPLTARPAEAVGKISLVVLEAEGLSFQVLDTAFLDYFAFSYFPGSLVEAPPELGKSVLVTRYVPVDVVYIQPYDQLIYYPSEDGSGGYVYYVDKLEGSSEYEKLWYQGTPEAEKLIRDTFASHTTDLNKLVIVSLVAFASLVFLVLRNAR
ncbi:MAG TPA: hypothetical protein VLH85_06615 [Levilinea sp.]|nr:hypothetical protein [Levilinea sp.]